jgi:hypothetical protein
MMYEQVGRFQRGFLWKKISSVEREEIWFFWKCSYITRYLHKIYQIL